MGSPGTGFTITATEECFRGQFLAVDRLTIRPPGGGEFHREVLRQHDAVAALLYEDGDVILLRQYRAAVGGLSVEIPAGICDRPDEPLLEAVQRECVEEVGYLPGTLISLATVQPAPGYASEQVHVYLGLDLEPRPRDPHGPEEAAADVLRLPFAEALAMAVRGEIRNAATLVALYAAAARTDHLLGG